MSNKSSNLNSHRNPDAIIPSTESRHKQRTMGGAHSRSEDLYKKSIINSETFIGSVTATPGYFSQTVHTLDFVDSKFPNSARTEMSYTGPPSHLQNSIDVHPFWSEFGREFLPADRFHDRSEVPRGLVPGTDTAQEMRNLELKESLQDLRSQVKAKMAQVRPILEEDPEESTYTKSQEGVDEIDSQNKNIPPLPLQKPTRQPSSAESKKTSKVSAKASKSNVSQTASSKEGGSFQAEKLALDFLDSVIMESMTLEDDDEEEEEVASTPVTKDSNWSLGTESFMKVEMRRRNLDKPVPGVMREISPVGSRNSTEPTSNGGMNVKRSSMYLPDASFMNPHSAAAKSNAKTIMSYRAEAGSNSNTHPVRPRPKSTIGMVTERTLTNGDSTASIDTGIFLDSGTTNSASSNDSGIGSGGGVRDLVKIYNEQTRSSTLEPSWKRHSTNLDNVGRKDPGRPGKLLERSLSNSDSLPLDDSLRVPRNSSILEEIRKELQLSLSN